MKALCQPGSNRSCVNSEATPSISQGDLIPARKARFLSPVLLAFILLGVAGFAADSILAQDNTVEPPAAAVAPPDGSRGFGTQVDEAMRFGVSVRDLYERIEPALVEVVWGGLASGVRTMGFRVADDDTFATVVPGNVSTEGVLLHGNGVERDGVIVAIDGPTGLSLIRARGVNPPSAGSQALRPVAERVYPGALVFGVNRLGTGAADVCAAGRLAGRDSVYQGEELPMSFYRVNMDLLHSTPGSPLLDQSGAVVGVLTGRRMEKPSEHHVLPASLLEKLLRDQERSGKADRAWIGASFHLKSTTPQVMGVRDSSPAAESGLRAGDIILSVGKTQVTDLNDLVDAFYVASIGERMDLEVLRGIERLTVKLTPKALPEAVRPGGLGSGSKP